MKNLKLLEFKLQRNLGTNLFGLYKSKFHGEGIEFAEHKEYTPSDNIKHIDWKVSSRSSKLFVKKFEEEKTIKVLLVVDINESFYQFSEKLQLLQEVIFLLGNSVLYNNDILYINNQPIKNYYFLANFLEKLNKQQITFSNLNEFLEKTAKNKQIKDFLIFILTDKDHIDKKIYKLLSFKNEVYFINIFHHFENNLQKIPSLVNLANGEIVQINLNDTEKIKQYQLLRQEKLKKLKQTLASLKIKYLYLDNQLNPFTELAKLFL